MTPSDYMNQYLRCTLWLADDSVAEVNIDQYLNRQTSARARAAWRAYEQLVQALAKKTGKRPWASQYEIDGWVFPIARLRKAFVGKGSPGAIQDVFLAASYRGLVGPMTVQDYADKYLGTDCNGFVGNYFGLDPNTDIASYDQNRRTDVKALRPRDVVVFVSSANEHKHIAVVDSVGGTASAVRLVLVHSRGENAGGVQSESVTKTFKTDRQGHIYFEGPLGRHGYIVPPASASAPTE
jgi:hypothetical protein